MKHRILTLLAFIALATLGTAMHAASPRLDPSTATHVLNRITFGPRPGDEERVRQMGVARFIDEQLHPERLRDDDVQRRLAALETLQLGSREIAQRYEIPAVRAQLERQQAGRPVGVQPPQDTATQEERQRANLPMLELAEQKILRAAYSDRQLEEVLTDFWFNHFNVDARKGPTRFMLTEYERDAIRPHVLGKFRDLLGAVAKSPAMLFYLDNWMSADPNGPHVVDRRGGRSQRQLRQPQRPRAAGLNENYGRELMELHTLGVDGGYTQKDVTEVARAFTGWTIDRPRLGGGFRFAPALHDDGAKTVLGHHIKAGGGQGDGERVLDILASHPSTARFISLKLARRFVSDTPSDALVARMATAFRRTDGDLREVMRVMLTSDEFLSPRAAGTKVKTPFEFVISALRATGADVTDARAVVRTVQQLGMPLYQCQPPTGYKDTSDAWVSTGALVSRMNAALALASGRMPGVTVPEIALPVSLIAGDVSDTTQSTIARAGQSQPQAIALALGSPEFQKH